MTARLRQLRLAGMERRLLQSQTNVARSPPATTYTAIPMGNRKLQATVFMPVKALTAEKVTRQCFLFFAEGDDST